METSSPKDKDKEEAQEPTTTSTTKTTTEIESTHEEKTPSYMDKSSGLSNIVQ